MFLHIWAALLFTVTDISSSSGLRAKPTLMIPPLTEGKEATLTCTAPDSCSGPQSNPEFNWIWVHPGDNNSSIAGNKTEIQSSNSTLIFNPSAEHHGTVLICQVTCSNRTSAKVTVTLNVTYVKKPGISGETSLLEGDALNLTCTADSFPPSVIKWTKHGINTTLSTETGPALIIYNVTVEDSGQYSCAVTHPSILTQHIKITVIIKKKLQITGEKDVAEGRSLNLTCSLDSLPPSFITWTKLDLNSTVANGTGAATLFIPNTTAEHSGQYVCSAEHLNNTLTQEVDVKVKYVRKLKIYGSTTVKEGDAVNLTCTVDSVPPSIVTWTKHGNALRDPAGPDSGSSSLVIHNVTVEDSGLYFCTANYLTVLTQDVNISVISRPKAPRSLKITGETVVTEGRALKLTCSVDSWPLAVIAWTELRFNTTLQNGTGATSLIIYNVTAEHSGLYRCTAKHLDNTLMEEVDIKVKMLPRILNESVCEAQLGVLTCVCVSQGLPLPTIKWLLSENQTEYSFNTAVSNHTVKSTLTVTRHSWRPAVCVSGNENGETKANLVIKQVDEEGLITKLFRTVTQLGTAVPFLAGMLLSSLVFCLVMLCCRKKQQAKESTSETLEMVMSQENSLTNNGQVMEYEQIHAEGTAGAAEEAEAGGSDVEYSDIKLLVLKKNTTGKKWKKQESEDTENMYAKIKLKETKPQANEDKEEEELRLNVQEVAEGEDVAVYSTVMEKIEQS